MSYLSPATSALRAYNRYQNTVSRSTRVSAGECPVCLGQHDQDIHIATIRIHRWFREEVTKGFIKRPVC